MDNLTPGTPEKLVQYLDGELTGTEKANIEGQLDADPSLKAEMESLQSTRAAVKWYGLQQQVASVHSKMMEEKQPRQNNSSVKKILRYSMGIAAGLFILISGYLAYNFFTLSADKVFASKYQPYELITVRDGNTVETFAEKAYRQKNYTEVIRIHDAGEDLTRKGIFLCGAAALEVKDQVKAIRCFKGVLDSNLRTGETQLNDEAEYYLSLAYIRNRDYTPALDLLYKIKADLNHTYHNQISAKLIRQVKLLKRK